MRCHRINAGTIVGTLFFSVFLLSSSAMAASLTSADTHHNVEITRADADAAVDRAFNKMDTNHNGHLSYQEFAAGQPGLPAHATERARQRRTRIIHEWFDQIDRNDNGQISMQEYRKAMTPYFNRLDTNHNGVLSASELQAASGNRSGSNQNESGRTSSKH